jgi:hypothetical protein
MLGTLGPVYIVILHQTRCIGGRNCSTMCSPRVILRRQAMTAAKTARGLTVRDKTPAKLDRAVRSQGFVATSDKIA